MENNFEKLVNKAYENVRMASYAIDCIMERIENPELAELLRKQNKFYLDLTKEIEDIAKSKGVELEDIGMMAKAASYVSIKMKTMVDNDSSKLSEMLVQGTTMGITDSLKAKRAYPTEDERLTEVMDRLVSHEEEFVDSLKTFL